MSQPERGGGSDPGLARARTSPDPGLARMRTSLAWTRTALAFAAMGALILRRELIAGLVVLALSVLVWAVGRLAVGAGPVRGRPGRLLVISAAVTGVSFIALVLALFGPQTTGFRP
jgi:uncharacterized membrane protein YidH (DUF202 family)